MTVYDFQKYFKNLTRSFLIQNSKNVGISAFSLFPLNSSRWLACYVVNYTVYIVHFVYYSVTYFFQHIIWYTSNTRMNSLPIILRFVSGSVTLTSFPRNISPTLTLIRFILNFYLNTCSTWSPSS
jgi:hypothetical protein